MINEYDIEDMASTENIRKDVLAEASSIVNGARTETYGTPEDSFQTIANFWNVFLLPRDYREKELTTIDVAIMLGLMKVARLKTTPNHRDSWVDIAGYAACGAECALKE